MKNNSGSGFTLVELSIVLVIIGLLIGGILAASSMIETAKIGSVVRQMGQYDAAVNNFSGKYACIPGDCEKVVACTNCNSNGTLNDDTGATSSNAFTGEVANFWYALSLTENVLNKNKQPYAAITNPLVQGVNIPEIDVKSELVSSGGTSNIVIAAVGNPNSANALLENNANYYMLGSLLFYSGSSIFTDGGTKPAFALAVDTKMDDNYPNTGFVRSFAPDGSGVSVISNSATLCASGTTATSAYNVGPGTGCAIFIKMQK